MTEIEPSNDRSVSWQPWGFWATSGLGLLVVVLYLLIGLLVAIALVFLALDTDVNQGADAFALANSNPNFVIGGSLVSAVIAFLLVLLIAGRRRGASWIEYLAVRRPAAKELLVWLGISVATVIVLGVIGELLDRPAVPELWEELYRSSSILPILLLAVIAAPLFEESLFRGFLFTGWSSSKLGVTGTILLTAAFFTVLHAGYDAFDLGQVFVLGVLLGIARYRSGSLVVPVVMHAFTNALAFLQMAYILGV